MKFEDITFVVQGPIHPTITQRSILTLKEVFPGSHIILSTWEGEDVSGLHVDVVIFNQDPGSTTFVYSKKDKAVKVNINRQIASTYYGLKAVKTKYAAKLRADNVLHSTNIINLFEQYSLRDERYSFLNQRLVCSNFYAKEFERGLCVPYFYSDFFQFGKTTDLLNVWNNEYFSDYVFREELSGKKQHEYYPNDSVNVEQKIWSHFVNQFIPTKLTDEHGTREDVQNSRNVMLNNLVVVDGDVLGLEVPERLHQNNGYPYYFYTYQRWQWLYEREFGVSLGVPLLFKAKWTLATSWKFLRKGMRLKIRKLVKRS
ncbi:wavE lipopolysaccharide synthesis family protein [Vibrio tubiashii]|nr:wavE lipopolysaccharide synthesis family protein [Vibrio tubiashii]